MLPLIVYRNYSSFDLLFSFFIYGGLCGFKENLYIILEAHDPFLISKKVGIALKSLIWQRSRNHLSYQLKTMDVFDVYEKRLS